MWEITQEAILYIILVATNITAMMAVCNVIMKRRRSFKAVIIFCTAKTIIVNVVIRLYLADLIATNSAVQVIYFSLTVLAAILNYIVFLYTFDEDFAKIAIFCSAAEMVTMLMGNGVMAVINMLYGEPPFSVKGPIRPTDLMVPVITAVLVYGLIRIGRPLWKRMRSWEVKYKKEIMTVFVIYLAFSIIGMHSQFDRQYIFIFICYAIVGPYMLVSYVNYFYRKTKWENEVLKKQQSVMRLQYEAVSLQIEKIKRMQDEMQAQMQEIRKLSDQKENKTEQLEKYIESLKNHSQQIQTGIFCNDWYLDSVLYDAVRKCQHLGIKTDFSMQGYRGDPEQNEELAKAIQKCLNGAMEKAKHQISLHVATIKGQIIIKLKCDEAEITQLWTKKQKQNWRSKCHFW